MPVVEDEPVNDPDGSVDEDLGAAVPVGHPGRLVVAAQRVSVGETREIGLGFRGRDREGLGDLRRGLGALRPLRGGEGREPDEPEQDGEASEANEPSMCRESEHARQRSRGKPVPRAMGEDCLCGRPWW
jgi:hypothetical protein